MAGRPLESLGEGCTALLHSLEKSGGLVGRTTITKAGGDGGMDTMTSVEVKKRREGKRRSFEWGKQGNKMEADECTSVDWEPHHCRQQLSPVVKLACSIAQWAGAGQRPVKLDLVPSLATLSPLVGHFTFLSLSFPSCLVLVNEWTDEQFTPRSKGALFYSMSATLQ